jgi:hypothetical protein
MGELHGFVDVRCVCGRSHTLLRHEVLEGLNLTRWKCRGCGQRFVVACSPGGGGRDDEFWPIFLDQVPSDGSTREEGLSADDAPVQLPERMQFQCRCGCRLTGKSSMYEKPAKCPKCKSTLVLRVGYHQTDGRPVPLLDYPELT